MKVDLYIARNKDEEGSYNKKAKDAKYKKRVNDMGVIKDVKAKLYIKGE